MASELASEKFYPPTIPSEAGSLGEQADRTGRTGPGAGATRSLVPIGGGSIGSSHPASPGPRDKDAVGFVDGTPASEASGWSGRVGSGSLPDRHPAQSP
eukprot:6181646-Pleurochrysis_carterae.AAC.1